MTTIKPLDLDSDDSDFRKYCEEQGDDYDKLLEEAGKCFTETPPWMHHLTNPCSEIALPDYYACPAAAPGQICHLDLDINWLLIDRSSV